MTQKFWIGVVAGDHAKLAVERGVVGFSHGKQSAVAKLTVGDRFILYAPKSGMGTGETLQAFVALGTIKGEEPYVAPWATGEIEAWVRDAEFAKTKDAPTKPMLEDLSFVTNPRYWGMAFRRSLFEISPDDFAVIANAMSL